MIVILRIFAMNKNAKHYVMIAIFMRESNANFRRLAASPARLPPLVWAAPAGPPDAMDAIAVIK